jgi:hypothetical protein|nr:MAG TPA: hypothetical protein [Caudoviricetes sp.]
MKIENYPEWLVPLEIARKINELKILNSEILVCNDNYYGWYRNEEIYDYDNDGDFIVYTALEASEWKDSNLEPTYTWEQVFEWFREKGFRITLENHEDSTKFIFYNMKIDEGKHFKGEFSTYEQAREALIKELIRIYKNENSI